MQPHEQLSREITRRTLLGTSARGLGALALASLLNGSLRGESVAPGLATHGALPALHFAPKAKRVIYLFMSGAPSHIDLYDNKPKLKELTGSELPDSVRMPTACSWPDSERIVVSEPPAGSPSVTVTR